MAHKRCLDMHKPNSLAMMPKHRRRTRLRLKTERPIPLQHLANLGLFEGISPNDLANIATVLQARQVPPGEYVLHEGDKGSSIFIVQDGELEVLKLTTASDFKVNHLRRGDFFGEMAILDQQPRSASVRALTEVWLLELHQEDLFNLFNKYPDSARLILERMSLRMRNIMGELQAQLEALHKSHHQLLQTYDATLQALSRALDLRDTETEGHSQRVTLYACRLAEALGLSAEGIQTIRMGALLHDVGKIGVPDAILRKPASLNPEERLLIQQHPVWGYDMLKDVGFLADCLPIVLYHHEKIDGSGYPAHLTNEDIPLGARIFAIVDAFDAMTSARPYRKVVTPSEALEELRRCSGTHFDAHLVDVFSQIIPALISWTA
ncbi:MAG: cyclic nucleotide-binding domain-containing protein [Chloroflexi bacterium]|nr:cyclic nucleotide-binding domain-containing protein [Chloroflexota bacterium]